MEDSVKTYIQTNALHGFDIFLGESIPILRCPPLNEIGKNFLLYLYYVNKHVDLYDDYKANVYDKLIASEDTLQDFVNFINFFVISEKTIFKNDSFVFDESKIINRDNIELIMDTIKILHHRDRKDDNYKPSNKIAEEMMRRARELKKEIESKVSRKDGTGFLEISSTVSARHPSINLLNITQLNYFQIIDQYKRLISIDKYTPCLYGNATEEYIKSNNVKHYSEKLINE
jgi:hypothetical protein